MDVIRKVSDLVDILNDIDNYNNTLVGRLSELDGKEQDLLHYIEANRVNMLWCYRMVRQIKKIREERRKVKNDIELLYRFNELKSKLPSLENRQFILTELHKKAKRLENHYQNRQYSEDDINNILVGEKDTC